MVADKDLSNIYVTDRLPAIFTSSPDVPFPPELTGATIVFIGTPSDRDLVEGGGLVIDFVPQGSSEVRRIVFGNTELGMWIEYLGERK